MTTLNGGYDLELDWTLRWCWTIENRNQSGKFVYDSGIRLNLCQTTLKCTFQSILLMVGKWGKTTTMKKSAL
jgi:hypothetical protein